MPDTAIEDGLADVLARLLRRDIRTADAIQERLREEVLALPDAITYGRVENEKQLAASADPFERLGAENPTLIPIVRQAFGHNGAVLEAALARSRAVFSGNPYPGLDELLSEAGTDRVVEALRLCNFNGLALHALTQIFLFTGRSLPQMRVSLERLRLSPGHRQSRSIAATAAARLEWHREAVALLEPNLAALMVGLDYDPWNMADTNARFAESLCGWLEQHLQSGRPGLVGGLMTTSGEEVEDPFTRIRLCLSMCRTHFPQSAQNDQQRQEDARRVALLTARATMLQQAALSSGRIAPDSMAAQGMESVH